MPWAGVDDLFVRCARPPDGRDRRRRHAGAAHDDDGLRRGGQRDRDDRSPGSFDELRLRRARSPGHGHRPARLTTTTAYDADGNVIATTDPRGYHDHLRLRRPEPADRDDRPADEITTTVYDAVGNVIETIDPLRECDDVLLRRARSPDLRHRPARPHDDHGLRRGRQRHRDDRPAGPRHDLHLRRARIARPSVEQPDGGITTTVYDADDNVIATIDPLGHTTTTSTTR